MTKPIGAIVLAAGSSTRFGSSKLLAELHSTKPVFQQTMERISAVFSARVVVTRPELLASVQPLATNTTVHSFDNAERGMGATLAFAAKHVGSWGGCVVCLGDMPFVAESTYRLIALQLTQSSIVIPTIGAKTGNPVAFGSNYFSELTKLDGDSGGRKIIELHPDAVQRLAVDDPGILQDIDTQGDLARYQD
ncbi:MAG: nucleotidyltransferase family protein [Pseudohongiellaceae bacterium]